MRIVHYHPQLDPKVGGPPFVAVQLAEAQRARGHDTTILTMCAPDPSRVALLASKGGVNSDVLQARFAPGPSGNVSSLLSTTDVVHLHGLWSLGGYLLARTCRSRGIPYVVAPHGMLDPWSLSQRAAKKRLALALGFRGMLEHAGAVHALTHAEAAAIRDVAPKTRVVVIPNGVDPCEGDVRGAPRLRHAHPVLGDAPYVLFLSRLHYKKGLDILAEAFAAIHVARPDLFLVVAGPDDGALAGFQAEIERRRLGDRTVVTGPLYGPDKRDALCGASVFCLPSRQEGFSIAIAEALACGIPCVVSEQCNFPWISECNAGVVAALAASSIAAGLIEVLSGTGTAREMGMRGQQLVRERFSWAAIADQAISMYRSVHRR